MRLFDMIRVLAHAFPLNSKAMFIHYVLATMPGPAGLSK